MSEQRPSIIDFVNTYTAQYGEDTFLREKSGDVWTETSFNKTREEAYIYAAAFMAIATIMPVAKMTASLPLSFVTIPLPISK